MSPFTGENGVVWIFISRPIQNQESFTNLSISFQIPRQFRSGEGDQFRILDILHQPSKNPIPFITQVINITESFSLVYTKKSILGFNFIRDRDQYIGLSQ